MALEERDREVARKYGAYASYTETDAAPMLTMDWGESAAGGVDRLLDRYAGPDAIVLDIGCGAGQTLPSRAPRPRYLRLRPGRRPADGGAGTGGVPWYHQRDVPARQCQQSGRCRRAAG